MIKTKLILEININIEPSEMTDGKIFLKWLDGKPDKINDAFLLDLFGFSKQFNAKYCVVEINKLQSGVIEQ